MSVSSVCLRRRIRKVVVRLLSDGLYQLVSAKDTEHLKELWVGFDPKATDTIAADERPIQEDQRGQQPATKLEDTTSKMPPDDIGLWDEFDDVVSEFSLLSLRGES